MLTFTKEHALKILNNMTKIKNQIITTRVDKSEIKDSMVAVHQAVENAMDRFASGADYSIKTIDLTAYNETQFLITILLDYVDV